MNYFARTKWAVKRTMKAAEAPPPSKKTTAGASVVLSVTSDKVSPPAKKKKIGAVIAPAKQKSAGARFVLPKKGVSPAVAPSGTPRQANANAAKAPLVVHLQTKGNRVLVRICVVVGVLVTWCILFWSAPTMLTLTGLTNAERIDLLRSKTQLLSSLTMAFAKSYDNAFNVPGLLEGPNDVVQTNMSLAEAQRFEEYFSRCMYLYLDALAYQEAARGGGNVAVLQKQKLLTIDYFKANAISGTLNSVTPVEHLTKYIRAYFDTTKEWATAGSRSRVLRSNCRWLTANGTALAEVNGSLVQLNTTWSGTGDIEYEIDVANECGPKTCGMENRRLAPEPQISACGVCLKNQPDCAQHMSDTSMLLFGVGRKMIGKEFRLFNKSKPPTQPMLRKAVVVNPFLYHRITFGLLSFELVDLAKKFYAECTASAADGGCMGLTFPIPGGGDHVVVGVKSMPMADFGHGFDLLNNMARARPLVTRFTTGALIDYEILRPANFEVYSWPDTLNEYECSGKMERSISDTEYGRRYSNVSTSRGWSLRFYSNQYQAFAKLEIPDWQAVLGFMIGGLLALGVVFLMQVKWEQTVDAPDALIRVLADASCYPDAYLDVVAANGTGDNLCLAPIQSITFTRADSDGQLVFKDPYSGPTS